MIKATLFGLIMMFLSSPTAAGDWEASGARPVFHDELAHTWDELARGLYDWGSRWSEHFGARAARERRPLISFMLRHRDRLALSSEQIRTLEQLKKNYQRHAIRSEADLRIAELDLAGLLESEPVDLEGVEAKVREIERLRADLRIARIRAIERGKQQLSAEQRATLNDLLTEPGIARPRRGWSR